MGFFDSFPPPEPSPRTRPPRRLPWHGPGHNIAPVALAVDAVLLRNDTKAVFANGFDVYPDGFAFTVNTLIRRDDADARRGQPGPFPRTANPFAGLSPRGEAPTPEEIDEAFSVGVRYADGRAAEVERRGSRRGRWHDGAQPPERPLLSLLSGHGSGIDWTQGLWAWGIPEAGDVELLCRWPAEQVSGSSLMLDGDQLRDAAARAVTLWDEPDDKEVGGSGYARG